MVSEFETFVAGIRQDSVEMRQFVQEFYDQALAQGGIFDLSALQKIRDGNAITCKILEEL